MRCLWLILIILLMTAANISAQENEALEYGNPDLLVDAEWLLENLEQVVIVDLRDLEEYTSGHIPGAVHLDYNELRAEVEGIPAQLADAETIAEVLGKLGISADDTIILYDDANLLDAALVFWTLEAIGHEDVRLLNGGWGAWDGYDISEETPEIESVIYEVNEQPEIVVDAEWVADHLDDESVVLIDARSPEEYSGEDVRAAYGGYIPGAYNVNWTQNLEDSFFLPPDELAALYENIPLGDADTIVTYCQTGHRASVAYFTMRLLGYEDVRVYDGSWVDWGNRDDLPHITGSEREADS